MDVPIFLDNVSQKDWYKLGIGQIWLFQSFSDNFSQKDWYKIWNGKNGHFILISNNFSQEDWYKFGMAKNGCSKFFPTIFPRKTGIN